MSLRTATLGTMLASAVLFFTSLSAQAADPTVAGTWELNVAKSKSTSPMPKSQTRTYEVDGVRETMTAKGVDAQGKETFTQFTATTDGKDSPFKAPGADTIALTRVDAWTNSYVAKNAGKVVWSGTRTISKDGKTMTITAKGSDAAGKPRDDTQVFDRR